MDYSEWGVRQLQDECRDRGLPTARSKADMAQRLADDDAANGKETTEPPVQETVPAAPPAEPGEATPESPAVYRCQFPAELGGPDEETHLANRLHARQAAVEAGHMPRGDAHRVGTIDGHDVYEVNIRRTP